ncbi:MAG: ParB/RepB/Spo0J family partition protein [Clostridia bacterium]|jgi:ParB family chromosome partitioning protein|nr:ParB/RepB/Spo0J family partition protein [Clostridia bacterium]
MLKTSTKGKASCQIQLIPHENIYPNPRQPRVRFDYIELENLASSIRANGILQPINVRPLENDRFELISGERRLRAARITGITKIPCIVMDVSDEQSALFAIIENVQRQNLDFFEEAVAIERLMTEHNLSQEEIGRKLGKAQSTLSNKLRLLRLPEEMRDRIVVASLTERHARALLTLPDNSARNRALDIIIERHLTVSESERLIKDILRRRKEPVKPPIKVFKDMRIFINTLNHAVDSIRRAGIEADTAKSETDEYFEYVVRISKPNEKHIITEVVEI